MAEKHKTPEQQHAGTDWPQQVWLWPLEATRLALHSYAQWLADPEPPPSPDPDQMPLAWTTPNAVALQLPSMRLREFSHERGDRQDLIAACESWVLHQVDDFNVILALQIFFTNVFKVFEGGQ